MNAQIHKLLKKLNSAVDEDTRNVTIILRSGKEVIGMIDGIVSDEVIVLKNTTYYSYIDINEIVGIMTHVAN
ncbi:hypothetical protein UNDKW_1980 [Undibacterium sp. KW1]|uniref:hypothetical protein n=1 Tax=Undibacterium sp. KW1 TaxID=2058624 RepID=UPI001331ED44|nr:hypothetical protein [Undibacterium sp. KW1]BBB60253.1 hypothetical protein UNDKW_1980 [Undibacterium sp. KW1]